MAGFTRAKSFQLELLERHEHAEYRFERAVRAAMNMWTALELAVHNRWGGDNSQAKGDQFIADVLDLFADTKTRTYKDDVEVLLEEVMEVDFNTVLEDGSQKELGELFCELWRQCGAGDFTKADEIFVRHEAEKVKEATSNQGGSEFRRDAIKSSVGFDANNGDAIDSDEDADADPQPPRLLSEGEARGARSVMEIEQKNPPKQVPEPDEDGFLPVTNKKSHRGKRTGFVG